MTSAVPPTDMTPLQQLASGWAVRLTTFRKDGTPVGTAVNIVRVELLPGREPGAQ